MTPRETAEREAEKRERHKSKHMMHKRWAAVHDSVKGWHYALVDCPLHAAREAEKAVRAARQAVRFGAPDMLELVSAALLARVKAAVLSDSGRHSESEDAQRLSGEAMPERRCEDSASPTPKSTPMNRVRR